MNNLIEIIATNVTSKKTTTVSLHALIQLCDKYSELTCIKLTLCDKSTSSNFVPDSEPSAIQPT